LATFTGQLISATYDAILKTVDNDPIGAAAKQITDGLGNVTPLYISTTQIGIGITPTEVLHVSGNIKATGTLTIDSDATIDGNISFDSLTGIGVAVTINKFVSQADGIASNDNDTTLPTSAAVKDYVDTKAALTDELSEVLAIGNTTGATNIIVQKSVQLPTTSTGSGVPTDIGVLSFGGDFTNKNRIFNDTGGGTLRIEGLANLYLRSENFLIGKRSVSQTWIKAGDTGTFLYYQGSERLTTTSTGVEVTGTLDVSDTLIVNKAATAAVEIAQFKVDGTGGTSGNLSYVSILPGSDNFATQLRLHTNNTGNNYQSISNISGGLELATNDGNPMYFKTDSVTRLTISNTGNATFTGTISGVGILSDGSTAITQSAADASTKVATTAYADAAASAVPIGDYLPLIGGTLTGALTGTTATFAGNVQAPSILANGTAEIRSDTASLYFENAANNNYYRLKRSSNDFVIDYYNGSTTADRLTIDSSGNSTFAGDVTVTEDSNLHNILFTADGLPAANIPSINLRDGGSNEFYWQLGSANVLSIVDYQYRNTIMGVGQTATTIVANGGSGLQNGILNLKTNSTSNNAGLNFINNGATASYNDIAGIASFIESGDAKGDLQFWTRNTDGANTDVATRMHIKAGGNVGINASDPVKTLDVRGQLAISNSASSYWYMDRNDTTGNFEILTDSDSSVFNIDSSGNVGISTDSPNAKLDVYDSSTSSVVVAKFGAALYGTANNTYIEIGTQYADGGSRIGNNNTTGNASSLLFETMTTTSGVYAERMRIDSSGNVGIGSAPGSYKLDVTGNGRFTGFIEMAGGGAVYQGQKFYLDGGGDTFLESPSSNIITFTTNATEKMRITSGGTILFGKDTTDVDIVGFRFDAGGTSFSSIINAEATHYVRDTTNSLYRFYVTGAGQIYATSTSITAISDITLKENIKPLETGLNEVMKLQPRRFDWKNGDGENIAGFVAQEVEEILPDLVSDYKYTDEQTKKSLKMGDMIPTLVKAIQELKAEVDLLKSNKCNCK